MLAMKIIIVIAITTRIVGESYVLNYVLPKFMLKYQSLVLQNVTIFVSEEVTVLKLSY